MQSGKSLCRKLGLIFLTMKEQEKVYPYQNLSLDDMNGEVWKDISGYEGYYQVSNMGRVKSLPKLKGVGYITKCKIMNCGCLTNGYPAVNLKKDGLKMKRARIHRLVALAFIPQIEGKYFIDHINGIKVDNEVDNLRWCTHKENDGFPLSRHNRSKGAKLKFENPIHRERMRIVGEKAWNDPKRREAFYKMINDPKIREKIRQTQNSEEYIERYRHQKSCRAVLQFDLLGNLVAEYYSASEAHRQTKICHITACCRGERPKAGGFTWKFK